MIKTRNHVLFISFIAYRLCDAYHWHPIAGQTIIVVTAAYWLIDYWREKKLAVKPLAATLNAAKPAGARPRLSFASAGYTLIAVLIMLFGVVAGIGRYHSST